MWEMKIFLNVPNKKGKYRLYCRMHLEPDSVEQDLRYVNVASRHTCNTMMLMYTFQLVSGNTQVSMCLTSKYFNNQICWTVTPNDIPNQHQMWTLNCFHSSAYILTHFTLFSIRSMTFRPHAVKQGSNCGNYISCLIRYSYINQLTCWQIAFRKQHETLIAMCQQVRYGKEYLKAVIYLYCIHVDEWKQSTKLVTIY